MHVLFKGCLSIGQMFHSGALYFRSGKPSPCLCRSSKRDDPASFVALTLPDIHSAVHQEQLKVISDTYGTCPFFPTDVLATGTYSHRIMTCHYSFNQTGFQQEFLHFPASDEFWFDSLSLKAS